MNSLKSKIASISKELDLVSKKNSSLKNDFDTHVCHVPIPSSFIDKHIGCSTLSSSIKNNIYTLNKSVDCLGSTLSQCAKNHTRLESMLRKKHLLICMHINHGIHMLTHTTLCMLMCTLVHIVDERATLQNFVMID